MDSSGTVSSPAHIHRLKQMKTNDIFVFRKGTCSFCRIVLKHSDTLYRCGDCDFNLCETCQSGDFRSDFHHHKLKPAKTTVVYPQTNGDWRCDGCQRVFFYNKCSWTRHCEECQLDLCEACYKDGWVHGLHPNHKFFPVDARLVYRDMEIWYCDNCGEERSTFSSGTVKMFHCDTCQEDGIDLCDSCFTGLKYWHHHHNLIQVINLVPQRQHFCTMCHRSVDRNDGVYVCVRGDCNYALCRSCAKLPPPQHPLHEHPLHCSDSMTVYPNTDGLWHCNNCTDTDPLKRTITRTPEEHMYHCSLCEYDLCSSCYGSYQCSQKPYALNHSEEGMPSGFVSYSNKPLFSFEPPPFPRAKVNNDREEASMLVGGSIHEPVPWRSVPTKSYLPEHGHKMINQQPGQMVIGFKSGPRY